MQSENPIIAGATAELIAQGWPERLIIYDKFYLQSSLYVDSVPGISWYIVVLVPAVLEVDHIDANSPLYYVVIAISGLAIVNTLIFLYITYRFRATQMMKLTKPIFIYFSLIGGLLLSISVIFLLGENNAINCSIRPFLLNYSCTIAISPLIIRAWNVHLIFNLRPLSRKKIVQGRTILFCTFIFLCIDTGILCSTLFSNGNDLRPKVVTRLTENGAYGKLTFCGYSNSNIMPYTEFAFKGSVMLCTCYLTFKIRNVTDAISGNKALLALAYNTTLAFIILAVVSSTSKDVCVIILCEAISICYCVIVGGWLLVFPVFYQIIFIGDAKAAAVAITDIFSGNKKYRSSTREGQCSAAIPFPDRNRVFIGEEEDSKEGHGIMEDPSQRLYACSSSVRRRSSHNADLNLPKNESGILGVEI